MTSLDELAGSAIKANGLDRVNFRDDIAEYGDAAVALVLPWALEARGGLAWFAVGVILAALPRATVGTCAAALRRVAAGAVDVRAREDAAQGLAHITPASARPASLRISPVPPTAGHDWPGFQTAEFGQVSGTVWRGRDNRAALAPIITRVLRYLHPHFESYSIYHSPEVHFGIRDRYQQGGEHNQGWRAGKLVVYAHGPTAGEPDLVPHVTAGLYIEKGLEERFEGAPEDLVRFGLLDGQWDWVWLVRALEDPHVQEELGAAMARHRLQIGDYS